jgi:hypothetical protein
MPHIVDPTLVPEQDESRRCQFCDYRGKVTAEHIWPSQYQQITPGVRTAMHEQGLIGAPTMRRFSAKAFSATARISCGKCNHERLKTIEDEALPYVAAMAANIGTIPLPLVAQRKLAAFALRMFAVAQYTHASARPIPRSHREHLITHRAPPQRVEVWAMGYQGAQERVHMTCAGARLAAPGERIPDRANAYHGLLRFGRLVLEIAALTDGRSFPFLPQDDRIFLRLWPIELNRVGIWPPVRMLGDAEWDGRIANLSANIDLRV